MSVFTPAEITYLQSQRLARVATSGPGGQPHVESVMGDVTLQVPHVVVPAHPRARLARHRQAGEFRGAGGGVQA